jgi:HD-like signal output (HDOD) protein
MSPASSLEPITKDQVIHALRDPKRMPTLPSIVLEITTAASNPNLNFEEFARTLSHDPVTTAQILRIANSSYYGLKEPAQDLAMAMVYIGFSEIHRLVLNVASMQFYRSEGQSEDCLKELWVHSLATANLAHRLGDRMDVKYLPPLYLAGLLHDIGKVFLASTFTPQFIAAQCEISANAEAILEIESRWYGMNHLEVADLIVDNWKFSPRLASIIRCHHTPSSAPDDSAEGSHLVAVANFFAHRVQKDQPVDANEPLIRESLGVLQSRMNAPDMLTWDVAQTLAESAVKDALRFNSAMGK